MKKIIIVAILFYWFFPGAFVLSQTITSKITPSVGSVDQKSIEIFKEKVANQVEQLRKKNNRVISGKIIDINDSLIKINTKGNEIFEIKPDETITKYYQITSNNQKSIKKTDLKKDYYIIISGIINDDKVMPNYIFVDQPYLVESGKIIEVDKENYSIKVLAVDKTVYTINIESVTKQQIINIKNLEIERAGFSKIIIGDFIHFTAKIKGDELDNTYSAEKILIIPQEYFMK